MTESAIVWISKCLNQQTSFQSQQMAGVAKISKCLSQQMSRPSQQMSNQQMSVSKCPVSKWKIGACPDTDYWLPDQPWLAQLSSCHIPLMCNGAEENQAHLQSLWPKGSGTTFIFGLLQYCFFTPMDQVP